MLALGIWECWVRWVLKYLVNQRIYFVTFSTWQRLELSPAARQVVMEACQFLDGQRYCILAGVIMPDHVHLLIQPFIKAEGQYWTIGSILHSIKSYSAKKIPFTMAHIGKVWQDGRYERLIHDPDSLISVQKYIQQNPIKAGIVESSTDYPFYWSNHET